VTPAGSSSAERVDASSGGGAGGDGAAEEAGAPASAPAAPAPRWRGVALTLAKVGVAAALIAWLARSGKIQPEVVLRALGDARTIATAFAAIGATFVFAILRWWVLLGAIDLRLPLRVTAKLTFIGGFFNTFMPGAVGGDAFKMYYVVEHAPPGKRVEAATTVAIDRVIGLGAMFVLVAVAALAPKALGHPDTVFDKVIGALSDGMGPLGRPLAVLGVVGALLVLACFHPGVRDWRLVRKVRERFPGSSVGGRIIRTFFRSIRSPWPVILACILSCCAHLCVVACFYTVGQALGEDALGLSRYVLIVPIGLMVNAIPGSPAGIGIGEAAYERLFAIALGAGVRSPGADICVVWRFVTIIWNLAGGVVYVLHRRGEPDPALLPSDP
jgi:hypothetical protein